MARPITAPELVNLRKDRQYSTLRASIIAPAQIWQGTVNQTFASYDMVTQITYTTTSGSTANIKPGMTLLVGSSTTGAAMWDAGQTRIRKVPAGGKLNIAETSDIAFNGKVLTVIEEFLPWPRHPRVTSSVVKMDWDVAYSDQNTDFTPVAIWGSDRVAEQLLPAGISLVFDASGSYCTGSTITGYAFACAGATITGGTTATPSILFPAPATYMVYLTLTAANGKTCVSSRVVDIYAQNDIVVDENTTIPARPAAQVKLDSCSGDWMAGGWTFDLTMVSGVDLVTVRPRARVILFAEDYYGSTKTSIGPLLGSENIIAIGWIGTQSTDINVAASSVSFTVYGAYYWIDQESSFPLGIRNITGAANAWINIHDLTVDKMLVNTLIWRTTLTGIVDCYLTGDTRKASELATQGGSIWAQLVNIAEPTILARPCCDRYSRLYIEINTQYLASKAGVPVVMSPTKGDDSAEFTFEKRLTAQTSQLRISGVYYNGTTAKAIFSLSPGHTPKQYGAWRNQDYLLLASAQATANNLCGDMMGVDNNPYPSITVN